MEWPPDFSERLNLLNAHGVEDVLVGGYAVGAHGFPRYTGAMELFYGLGEANTVRLSAALEAFGLPFPAAQLNQANVMFRLGVKPVMIEFMSEITGVTFAQAWANRVVWDLNGLSVPMISLADLEELPEE